MIHAITLLSFVAFTGFVGLVTYFATRHVDNRTLNGYFLAGRSLSFPFIAGSLLLTNLSTEQMVGLNGSAFRDGLSVMAWEVLAVLALVAMALFFLPRFLKSGIATVPQFLGLRFDEGTQIIANLIFLGAYVAILLPIILYTGAVGLAGMLDLPGLTGIESEQALLWLTVWLVGIIGACYALFGGLRSIAVSDLINGIGLLLGGLAITYFGLMAVSGDAGLFAGWQALQDENPERFNSIGSRTQEVPFETLFTGVLLLNLFYWCTNQQIIQRTFGASSLAEGQKGVLLTGLLKLLGPVYLVLPGIIAYHLYADRDIRADQAYGVLVNDVLPAPMTGLFAAVMVGAILSSFNSALNATTTLFGFGLYKAVLKKDATDAQVVFAGKAFGWVIALASMTIAPLLIGQESIFVYLQQMNGIYFIPIFAVVLVGMLGRRIPPLAAKVALVGGCLGIAVGYFVPPFNGWVAAMSEFHFLGAAFVTLVAVMLGVGYLRPLPTRWEQTYSGDVEMTPWRFRFPAAAVLVVLVLLIYVLFADFSVLLG
ncbi:MAG: solute:sodium symporter family transporter [Phycisphaeraceae bacterium]